MKSKNRRRGGKKRDKVLAVLILLLPERTKALSRSFANGEIRHKFQSPSPPNSNYKSPAVLAGELSDDYNATTPPLTLTPRSAASVFICGRGLRDQWLH
ncbi:hypothetical protein CEXT_758231 [Caerostris extrusa]|uniref:Secreted protein n=1 Tax=Caerostris extrusa TaxID=172846 RepID=A0AAV4PYE3_CAEEX|nr:hypothetical protein CEXT_758231 [Caerostris extrusa]